MVAWQNFANNRAGTCHVNCGLKVRSSRSQESEREQPLRSNHVVPKRMPYQVGAALSAQHLHDPELRLTYRFLHRALFSSMCPPVADSG